MKLTGIPSPAEHIVFVNESLPELLREVADFLDKDPVVWHIIMDCQSDAEGDFALHIYRYQNTSQ